MKVMAIPNGRKGQSETDSLFASYGALAKRLFPAAVHVAFLGSDGCLQWAQGDVEIAEGSIASLVEPILSGGTPEPQAAKVSDTLIAVAVPVFLDARLIGILVVHVVFDKSHSESRVVRDVAGAAAPLLDCLCREMGQMGKRTWQPATLVERTEELEWLFALTESMHSNSNDPRTIQQLLGAAVERMKCCFGAVVVPDHGLELTYSPAEDTDSQPATAFERSRPFFMDYVRRRRQPLIANKVSGIGEMQPFKILVVPIEPHKNKLIGYIALFKPATSPNFGRRQVFLGRHIGRQIGALLESQYDLATGLLTRSAFEQDVQRLVNAKPKDLEHSLIYFDIDRLHVINDTLGFDVGDDAILKIADLLRAPALPEDALASRIGGDSFVAFLPDHDAEQAFARANRVLAAAAQCVVGPPGAQVPLSMSCGVVRLYSIDSGVVGPLATAQMACKSAKEHGGGRAEIYLDIDDSMMRRRHDMFEVGHMRSALAESRFCVYAQKIVSAADLGEVRGMECLIRMIDDHGKIVGPGEFLPSAQRYQMLQAIDHWVISETLRQLKPHRTLLLNAGISVAINISGQSIQDEIFVEAIERWLLDSMVAPALIRFEITETVAISNLARAERLIRKLRQYGCGFALDDFGTGANSLSYLKSLPVTCVKIDGSFTKDLLSNNRSDVMVQTIVQLSRSLGIECVAECVESAAVADRVRELGVDYVQGFVAHRPEPLRELLESMQQGESQRLRRQYLIQ